MSSVLILETKKFVVKYISFINLINFTILKTLSCSKSQLQFADVSLKSKKMINFIIKFQDVWENLTCCEHTMNLIFKIKQFFSKIKSVFFNEIRKLHWSKNIQTFNWNFIVQIFKNVEHIKSIIIAVNSNQILTVQFNFNFWSDSDY